MGPPLEYTSLFVGGEEGELFLRVRAAPGSRQERIVGIHGDALRVAVRAAPERGKANAALAALLARELGLHPSAVALHGGQTSRDKLFRIEGIAREELLRRLRGCLGGAERPAGEGARRRKA
jgi:uncharacterized protein (TIGR00251 family)